MGLFGAYTYKQRNSKEKWWLHVKESKGVKLYFFSKNPDSALPGVPKGYTVIENKRTGLPMLKKMVKKGNTKKEAKS